MLKLLADENFDNTIIRGLLRRNSSIDIARVQDVALSGKDDPTVLTWAAQEQRVLLTHDVATITKNMPMKELPKVIPCQELLKYAPMPLLAK